MSFLRLGIDAERLAMNFHMCLAEPSLEQLIHSLSSSIAPREEIYSVSSTTASMRRMWSRYVNIAKHR